MGQDIGNSLSFLRSEETIAKLAPTDNGLDFGFLKPETFSELDDLAQTNSPAKR
jgi:hypothetical protein